MQIQRHPLLSHALGTSRELLSLHYGTPGAGPKAYLQASLHADELPGMLVAHHLRARLDELEARQLIRGEIVLVPVANPIGLAQWLLHDHVGRFELGSGENFNRHYPALAKTVWSRVEATLDGNAAANVVRIRAALKEALQALTVETELADLRRTLLQLACDADVMLDLHCDGEALMHLYTTPALWPQAETLARCVGADATLLADESGDQPFDEACSQLWSQLAQWAGADRPVPPACLSVTVELRGVADVDHEHAARDAQALLDFLVHRGVLALEPPPLPPLKRPATPLAGSIPVIAPASGVVVWLKQLGDWVRAGEVIGELIDPLTAEVRPLTSGTDGVFYARDNRHFATTGMRLAKVAGAQATRTGKLLGA